MLEKIEYGKTLEIRLARPPANALSPELVATLRREIEAAPATGAGALVISGRPGMFSAGLDVPALLTLGRAAMDGFFHDFFGLLRAIATSPIPIAAAITGHSPAGGAVLALYCDHRVLAEGEFKIGLNEVEVGLAVPSVIHAALRRLVGPGAAERMAVRGLLIDPGEAYRVGLVDELAAVDEVIPRALAYCEKTLSLPPKALAETRELCRRDLHEAFANFDQAVDGFLEAWFGAETQGAMNALVARLAAKG